MGQEAWRQLVEVHEVWLLRLLGSLLGNAAEAEDVCQEVFVKAWLGLEGFRGDSSLRTWLRKIATHAAFNHRRRRRELLTGDGTPIERADPRDAVQELVEREALLEILAAMPYPYREILVLRHVEALSMEEIAGQLDVGLSAAKMRLKRARERFTELWRSRHG